jgi:hypothetical protein
MHASGLSPAVAAESLIPAPSVKAQGTVSDMLARCDALHAELERLRTEHSQLLRYAEDLRRAYETERTRRQQLTETTLGLLSALIDTAPSSAAAQALARVGYAGADTARHADDLAA